MGYINWIINISLTPLDDHKKYHNLFPVKMLLFWNNIVYDSINLYKPYHLYDIYYTQTMVTTDPTVLNGNRKPLSVLIQRAKSYAIFFGCMFMVPYLSSRPTLKKKTLFWPRSDPSWALKNNVISSQIIMVDSFRYIIQNKWGRIEVPRTSQKKT